MAKPPKITSAQLDAQKKLWVMCTGKVAYETEVQAQFRALDLGLTYYACPHCKKWHLTKGSLVNTLLRRKNR